MRRLTLLSFSLPGASVQAIDRTGYRLAVAAEHAMQGGTHYAE
eukprot:COSAG01_NODE_75873_length_192_cov_25.913978_1_plen_42_part_01